ncbi:MAG: hypothetical protein GC186_19750 [Rhodobacteraceae bacterium]|nr:hypothetical protein [Paracoccaceae bacterium]
MQWILDNWLIVLLFGGMAAMHLFGHGHGGHSGHGNGGHGGGCGGGGMKHRNPVADQQPEPVPVAPPEEKTGV